MKALMPSLRENNRYVKFEIKAGKQLTSKEVEKGLQESFLEFLGSLELAKSSFKLVSLKNNKGIAKVNATYLNKLRGMFTMIQKMNNNEIEIKSLKTSGLINKLKEE